MVVFETYALVKFFKKEPGHEKIAEKLRQGGHIAEATKYELLYDVVRDLLKQGHDLHESIRKGTEIVNSLCIYLQTQNLTESIMSESIYFKIKYNKLDLSHFDCIAAATAKVLGQPLLSGEKGLAQVPEVKVEG